MAKKDQQQPGKPDIDPEDLDIVDDALEDAGKDDAELWSEFDQVETGASDADSPEASGDTDDAAPADADADPDKSKAGESEEDRAAADDRSGDDPPDQGATGEDDDDLWADAKPEHRAAYEAAQAQLKKLEQAERSNRGRLSALQRQMNELLADRNARPAPKKGADGDRGTGKEPSGGGDGVLESDDWKSFETEYPEVATPLKKLVSGLEAQVARQQQQLDAIGTDRHQEAVIEQVELLEQDHPDWQDVTAEPEFEGWLTEQPRHIREAAIRNADEIVDAAEAADVVSRFKAFRSADGGGKAPADTPGAGKNGQGNGTTRLSGRRQRQLESAAGTRSRGPGPATGIPEDGDPERIWKDFDELERRQAQRA